MLTKDEIMNMSDEEVTETNNKLKRQLVKKLAINAVITVGVATVFHLINKKIEKSEED